LICSVVVRQVLSVIFSLSSGRGQSRFFPHLFGGAPPFTRSALPFPPINAECVQIPLGFPLPFLDLWLHSSEPVAAGRAFLLALRELSASNSLSFPRARLGFLSFLSRPFSTQSIWTGVLPSFRSAHSLVIEDLPRGQIFSPVLRWAPARLSYPEGA